MKENNNEKENILIYKEKPYYTDEELRLYYQIAIDESLKQGNESMAAHYKILLDQLDNKSETDDKLFNMIMEHNKNKK